MSASAGIPVPGQAHEKMKADVPIASNALVWPCSHCGLLQQALQENVRLRAENNSLRDNITALEIENQKLYERVHLDSDTSSVPSSKCWKNGDTPNAFEEPADSNTDQEGNGDKETPISVTGYLEDNKAREKREPGGQRGHRPAFMRVDGSREGETVLHYPDKCIGCPRLAQCIEDGQLRKYYTSHGYDIEVIRVHRKHLLFEAAACPIDGCLVHDDFPEVIGAQFYDTNVQLHILTWHHMFHGSYDRIDLAAKELYGLSLSAGTANAIVQRVSARILSSGFIDAVRFFILLFEKVLGVDETSACVGGRNAWVHTAVTANVTLLSAHWRRGYEGIIYAGVLQFFTENVISDCWASYFNECFKFIHALCDGHILRELVAAAYFRQQGWAIEMFDLLLEVLSDKRDAVARDEKNLPQDYLDGIRTRYRQIVADGFNENAGVTKGKTISLLERLNKLEDSVLAFAIDFSVDFTNNASEQSLRDLKVALRVMGQFRTFSGLADYCIIQSFMDTCRKQGHNPFDMMRVLLSGGDIIEAVFGAEKSVQIKQMIRFTRVAGDSDAMNAVMADASLLLTDELLAAASYGSFKVYDGPPPEKKESASTVPKDKIQAARENNSRKKSDATPDPPVDLPQNSPVSLPKKKKRKTRAEPKSA